MSQYNNDATLDIAMEPQHHATFKEKVVGTAQIVQGRMIGSTSKQAEGHLKRDGHLDHRFPNEARARAAPHTEQGKRDLIRQAKSGQKEFEDGLGDVEGTFRTNPKKEEFGDDEAGTGPPPMSASASGPVREVERTVSDESVTSTGTVSSTER